MKTSIVLFLLLATLTQGYGFSQTSTGKQMEKQGLINIQTIAPDIQVSLMYSRADNFTGKILYTDLQEAYLHPKAAQALAKAQEILKSKHPHLSLKVYDAARPMQIQQKMWNTVAGTSKSIYVSNPKNGGGLHNYGMAVDVTLCNEQGDTLPMGTLIDYLGKYAHTNEEKLLVTKGIISPQARKNRELLRNVMQQAGFKVLRTEWWHFNFITRAQAKSSYKVIK